MTPARYLDALVNDGWISHATGHRTDIALRVFAGRMPWLPAPSVAPGPDGIVAVIWRTDGYYLSLGLHPNGRAEVFYEDLRTGKTWSEEAA